MNNEKNQFSQLNNFKEFSYEKFSGKKLDEEKLKINNVSQPKGGKKIGLIIGIIIGVIVLAGGGTGIILAARIWDPLWNPFRPEPEEVMENMFNNMKEVKKIHSKIDLTFEYQNKNKNKGYVSMLIENDSDSSDSKNLKSAGNFDFAVEEDKEKISLTGEDKRIGDDFYLKMDLINIREMKIMLMMMFGVNLDKIKGKWVKLDKKTLESLGQTYSEEMMSEEEQTAINKELKEIFTNHKIYYLKQELADEKIGNTKVYHYLLGLNKEEFKKIVSEIFTKYMIKSKAETKARSLKKGFASEENLYKAALIGAWKEVIDEFLDKIIGEIAFDLWIGKKDELLYKANLDKEIDMSKFEEENKNNITIKLNFTLSDFNKPIMIKAPKNYLELKDIFGGAGLLNQFPQPGLRNNLKMPGGLENKYQPYHKPMIKMNKTSLFQASLIRIISRFLPTS